MAHSDTYLSEYYDQKCRRYGQSHKAVGWVSRETQETRYRLALPFLTNGSALSILDVGCGQADFLAFLKENNLDSQYIGADLSSEMVQIARFRYPENTFEVASLTELHPSVTADVVVAFGTFSLKHSDGSRPAIRTHLKQLYDRCTTAALFNGLSTFAPEASRENSPFVYYDPMQLLSIALSVSPKAQLIHGKLDNDLTLILEK